MKKLEQITDMETKVMTQLALGLSRKMIAEELGIEQTTVNRHMESVFKKWNINSATAAVSLFVASK